MTTRQTPDAVREAVALLPKLRALLKPATARPWRVFDGGQGLLAIMKGDRPKVRSSAFDKRWKEIVKWAGFDGTDVGKRYDAPNATLIVEAVNTLSILLDAIEHLAALDSRAGDAGEEEGVPKGMKRAYVRCRTHDRIAHYDYVPYSFSSAVMVMPCGCDTKHAQSISYEQFLAATSAQTGGKLGWDADGVCDDHYREQCPDCARIPCTPAPAVDAVPAGEVAEQAHAAVRNGDYRMGYLRMCEAYGKLAALSHGEGRK